MARLFVSQREIKFISDLTKELIKDINGQKIYLHPISELRTLSHEVYNEAVKKVFDNPIEIDALVDSSFQSDTKIDQFGIDNQFKIEVFLQYRDLIEKGINVTIGDFFSFSDIFYEIVDNVVIKNIWGLAEHKSGIKLTGIKARQTQFDAILKGPTDIKYDDDDSVQTTFVQQRGLVENRLGKTEDVRELVRDGVIEPLVNDASDAREVSPGGDPNGTSTSFYGED